MSATEAFTGKYDRPGRVGGWLIDRFFAVVTDLVATVPAPSATLEVGAGAGFSSERLRPFVPNLFVASELEAPLAAMAAARNRGLGLLRQSAYALAHPDRSFDLIVMLEVLEHLEDPGAALRELRRVCRGHVVVSTPREPLWRCLNLARGKYISALGNTPGHIQHWSSRQLAEFASRWFEVVAVRRPIPWTVLLLRVRD